VNLFVMDAILEVTVKIFIVVMGDIYVTFDA